MANTEREALLPARTAVLRAQLNVVGWARRWVLVALGGFILLMFLTAAYGLFVRGEDLNMLHLLGGPNQGGGAVATIGIIAVFWALGVWHAEQPGRRLYHWSLPFDRGAHDRLRVAAGAMWLAAVIAVFLAGVLAMAVLGGYGGEIGDVPGTLWLNYFTGPLTIYLLASVAPVRSEHPLAWILGVVAALLLVPVLTDFFLGLDGRLVQAWESFLEGPVGPFRALGDGVVLGGGELAPGAWVMTMLLWLGIGIGAVYAATWRVPDA